MWHPHSQVYGWEIYHSDSFICHCKRLCKEQNDWFCFLINKAIKGIPTAQQFVAVALQVVAVALSYCCCCCCWLHLSQKRLTNDSKGRYWGISLARWRMAAVAWRDAVPELWMLCCSVARLPHRCNLITIIKRNKSCGGMQLGNLYGLPDNWPTCPVAECQLWRRWGDNDDRDCDWDAGSDCDCDWGASRVRETNNKWSRLVIYLCKAIKYDFVFLSLCASNAKIRQAIKVILCLALAHLPC